MLSKTEGIDYSRDDHELQVAGDGSSYALAVGARSIRTTLMDFLR
jgi:hypothetical protein